MSRRNASLVVALGVASLAAMVATGELLVESFGRPMPELDPPFAGLGPPEVIQVDPPERKRAKPPPGRSRAPAGDPPPARAAGPGGGLPGRRRVAPAWSWSWSAARPGGTG